MGWIDEQGNPVTDPGLIQQLELAEQGQQQQLGNYSPQLEAASLTDPTLPTKIGTMTGLLIPHAAGPIGQLAGRVGGAMKRGLLGTPKEEAVGNFLNQQFGFPATAGERVATTRPSIQAAYAQTGGQPNVPVNGIVKSVDQSLQTEKFAANPNENAIKYLTNLRAKYQGGPDALYTDLIDESQALRREALKYRKMGDPATAHSFDRARQGLNEQLNTVSPAARQAALTAQQGAALPKLITAARAKDPVVQLGNLFENKPSIAQAFGFNTPEDINNLLSKAQQMRLSQNPAAVTEFVKWLFIRHPYIPLAIGGAAGGYGLYSSHGGGGG